MRVLLPWIAAVSGVVSGGACGGSPPVSPTTAAQPAHVAPHERASNRAPTIDPIAALTAPDQYPTSFIVPGTASIELDGPTVQAPPALPDVKGTIVDEQAQWVRVAIRIDGLAYTLWTERARLLGIAKKHTRLSNRRGDFWDRSGDEPFAELRAGARVRMLKREGEWQQVRYLGALELDGWVPTSALVDRTTAEITHYGRMPTGLPTLTATPGTVIRVEPKWVADQIGVMANGFFLDTVKDIDQAWAEV
ncbi:MAG TPA: hypothetical protein VGC41_14410 [Kofleriaceae bacterium]